MKSTKDIEQSIKKLVVESGDRIHDRILEKLQRKLDQSKRQIAPEQTNACRFILLRRAGYLAAALLVICSLAACFIMSGNVTKLKKKLEQARRDNTLAPADDSATINFYFKEHQDVVAQNASMKSGIAQPTQMRVDRHDILYFESFDDGPEYMSPGIIVRGPSSQLQTGSPKAPTISNGHTLSLAEAKATAHFDLVAPPWLHPFYKLDQIRTIEDRDALQLLYTNGIDSISLFEQPLDGRRGLEPKDFREYAVYQNKGQGGGTILAWRDETLSYVLIGNIELSQLMDMAQSISAGR
ncbi:MAG: hypothetical protein P8Z79_00135 [Sedimentisphaerales bacterium]